MTRRDPSPYQGPPRGAWYGLDPAWRIPLVAAARRRHGRDLTITVRRRRLTYRLAGLPVTARPDPVPVTITFEDLGPDPIFGLPARDTPTVFADEGAASKHRNGDGSLCLYYPGDPIERRWHSELGLAVLLDLTAEHLFAELHWRNTGGGDDGEWVLDEAPHGYLEGDHR